MTDAVLTGVLAGPICGLRYQTPSASGVTLRAVELAGELPAGVHSLLQMPALRCVGDRQVPALTATLQTPLGERVLLTTR